MKYTKKEMEDLSWLPAMYVNDLTLLEIAKKLKFKNITKLKQFIDENDIKYKKA